MRKVSAVAAKMREHVIRAIFGVGWVCFVSTHRFQHGAKDRGVQFVRRVATFGRIWSADLDASTNFHFECQSFFDCQYCAGRCFDKAWALRNIIQVSARRRYQAVSAQAFIEGPAQSPRLSAREPCRQPSAISVRATVLCYRSYPNPNFPQQMVYQLDY
jgi:hypothetical protein